MAIEKFVQDTSEGSFPTVNVVLAIWNTEIQIHQAATFYHPVPTIVGDEKRDVISMSREQARKVARQILEMVGETVYE